MKFHVSWKEYWPFLDKFIDLRSEEGLKMLEDYLQVKSIEISVLKEITSYAFDDDFVENSVLTPISELCNVFAKCSIKSPLDFQPSIAIPKQKNAGDAASSPYLLIENVCVVCLAHTIFIFYHSSNEFCFSDVRRQHIGNVCEKFHRHYAHRG